VATRTARIGYVDYQHDLDAWFEEMDLKKNVILVVHDWGSALGFYWAQRHPERGKAIVYMEGIVRPFLSWEEWPEVTRAFFKAQRTPHGEDLILQKNLFIEYLLPLRRISSEAMEVYRRHYRNPGPTRIPMLSWTRELPIEAQPEDVVRIVDSYAQWLAKAKFQIGPQRDFCRAWPKQQTVLLKGSHFLQEEVPGAVGEATARFVSKVMAGQIA
jgi:haloalkane dehalogenase